MAIAPEQRWAIWGREGGYCGICGDPVPYREMHLDHIIPLSLGGPTEPWNLRPAHAKCNTGRGNGHVPRTVPGGRPLAKLIKMPDDLGERIAQAARDNRRSFTAQFLLLLEKGRLADERSRDDA